MQKNASKVNMETRDFGVFFVKTPVILKQLVIGAFCYKDKFVFLKSTYNSVSFDTHKPHISKKIFWP
jgi:hypothetical protein